MAAKKVAIPTRDQRIAELQEFVQKKMKGVAALQIASEYELPYLTKRIPTGLLSFDIALGGGWPCGGLSQIIGGNSAGKSLLYWWTIRQLQDILGDKMRVMLAMNEMVADRSQARLAGVKIGLSDDELEKENGLRKLRNEKPLTRKEADQIWPTVGKIYELHAWTAEDFYDVILRAVDQNMYHLIVLDSIGNVIAAAEAENESVHDKTWAGASGPNTTFLKKMTTLQTLQNEWGLTRSTCILAINQLRDDLSDPNKKYKATGGNALKHTKFVDVYLERGSMLGKHEIQQFTPEGYKKVTAFTGHEVNWKLEKGKAGIHDGARGRFAFNDASKSFDAFSDTLVAGINHGVIEVNGAHYSMRNPMDPKKELFHFNGRENTVKALYENAVEAAKNSENSYMDFIRFAAMKANNINIDYSKLDEE